jgi:Protein of unknown function (DUF2838)
MNLVLSSLVFAQKPEWIPALYTIQCCYFLPLRIYSYARKQWHYFLFDVSNLEAVILFEGCLTVSWIHAVLLFSQVSSII